MLCVVLEVRICLLMGFCVLGRGNNTTVETESRPSPQPGKEPGETSSVTEDDASEDDSDSREAQYRCSHCFTTSKFYPPFCFIKYKTI